MKIHKLCLQVPGMSPDEFDDLKRDIQDHGFDPLFPVVIYEGKILDGRHRAKACDELGVEYPTVEWKPRPGDCPESFVLRAACRRRNLTQAQRAALAAEMLPAIEEAAKERSMAGKADPANKVSQGRAPSSAEVAAKEAGTNANYVRTAKKAKEEAPEVFKAMKSGEMSVSEAKEAMKPAPPPPPMSRQPGEEALSIETKRLFTSLIDAAREIQDGVERLSKTPFGRELSLQRIQTELENAVVAIRFAMPHKLCKCGGEDKKCRACKGMGWVTKEQAERQKKS